MKIIDNKVVVIESDFNDLEKRGYTIDRHTKDFSNFIGVEAHGLSAGFSSWNHDLRFWLDDGDSYLSKIIIKTDADLNAVLKFMDSFLELKNIKSCE